MSKQYWPAIILIAAGVLLFLNGLDLIDMRFADIVSYGFIVGGILWFGNGMGRTDRKGVLAGTFFTAFGAVMVMMREGILRTHDDFGFAMFFYALGLANLVYFLVRSERWYNFGWAAAYAAIGSALLLSHYGYFSRWFIFHTIETYWPLILVAIGILFIIKGYRKRDGKLASST